MGDPSSALKDSLSVVEAKSEAGEMFHAILDLVEGELGLFYV